MRIPRKETIGIVALTVLAAMTSGKVGAKIVHALIREYYGRKSTNQNGEITDVDEKSFRAVLGRLHRDGLVIKDEKGLWGITKKGKNISVAFSIFLRRRKAATTPRDPKKKIVIVFDIPEKRRYERDMLRFELLALEFSQLQKSVWIGCGPLPADFIEYLKDHRLLPHVHVFSVNKKGTTSFAV